MIDNKQDERLVRDMYIMYTRNSNNQLCKFNQIHNHLKLQHQVTATGNHY